MRSVTRDFVGQLNRFARERTVGWSILLALCGAILALLIANVSTFVLVQRTVRFNEQVDGQWQAHRSGRVLLLDFKDAETVIGDLPGRDNDRLSIEVRGRDVSCGWLE